MSNRKELVAESESEDALRVKFLMPVVGLFVVSVVLGGLTAPPLFNLLLWLGRNFQSLEVLRNIEFERVVSRCVLLFVLAGVVPAMRVVGMGSLASMGFTGDVGRFRQMGRGLLVGIASMLGLYALGLVLNAYKVTGAVEPAVLGRTAGYFIGALLVGVIEEGLFRGAFFRVFRRAMGVIAAVIVSSVLFSAIHFAKPTPFMGVVHARWYSSFTLLPYMFRMTGLLYHYFPFCLTLFVMGVVLCVYFIRFGNVYYIIGLHAGWVWILRVGGYFFERNRGVVDWLFGRNDAAKSPIALLVISAFLVAGLLSLRKARAGRGCACDGTG